MTWIHLIKLSELVEHGFWSLETQMVSTVQVKTLSRLQYFVKARDMIQKWTLTQDQAYLFDEETAKFIQPIVGLILVSADYEPDV